MDPKKIIISDDKKSIQIIKAKISDEIKIEPFDMEEIFNNDRFTKYKGIGKVECEITHIKPATEEDIIKYTPKKKIAFYEDYSEYQDIVIPKVIKQDISWIHNILNHIQESEDIILETDDLIFLPDFKWDRKEINHFYGLVIFKGKRINSIRDLEGKHMDMLKRVKKDIENVLFLKYGFTANTLRMYFHYPPSFWYLHLHVNLVSQIYEGILTDYCHGLDTVIENLKINSNYYKKVRMRVVK